MRMVGLALSTPGNAGIDPCFALKVSLANDFWFPRARGS